MSAKSVLIFKKSELKNLKTNANHFEGSVISRPRHHHLELNNPSQYQNDLK